MASKGTSSPQPIIIISILAACTFSLCPVPRCPKVPCLSPSNSRYRHTAPPPSLLARLFSALFLQATRAAVPFLGWFSRQAPTFSEASYAPLPPFLSLPLDLQAKTSSSHAYEQYVSTHHQPRGAGRRHPGAMPGGLATRGGGRHEPLHGRDGVSE